MRINKLYTLDQFLYLIKTEKRPDGGKLYDIFEYHKFLNQPKNEEMFFNNVKKPEAYILYNMQRFECTADEMRLCREYDESEKKVIFKNFNYTKLYNNAFIIYSDDHDLHFHSSDFKCSLPHRETLLELSERTKGKLNLQNVEI